MVDGSLQLLPAVDVAADPAVRLVRARSARRRHTEPGTHIQERADYPTRVEGQVADALRQPREVVAAARGRLIDASLLGRDGALTGIGREQLHRCRDAVAETTQALTAAIDPAAARTTLDTLDAVRARAEQLLAG